MKIFFNNFRRYNDFDEYEADERERQQRKKLNEEFQSFVKAVEQTTNQKVTFDIPYRKLGFYGAPNHNNTFLMPTVHCLVSLTDTPFFVLTLDDVEFGHFERVSQMIKNFDLVFVHKDYTKSVTFINAIPKKFMEDICTWLDSIDIIFFEGQMNIKWDKLLKRIRADPEGFIYEEGGWRSFADDGDEVQEDDDSEQDDSVFDSADMANSDEASDEDEESDDDFDEEEDGDSDADSDGEDDDDDDDEMGSEEDPVSSSRSKGQKKKIKK